MFNLGGMEIVVILIVALLVLGPDKLPGVMRTLGKALGELRKTSAEFQRTMSTEIMAGDENDFPQAQTPVSVTENMTGSEETTAAVSEPAPRPGRRRPTPRIARKHPDRLPEQEADDPDKA